MSSDVEGRLSVGGDQHNDAARHGNRRSRFGRLRRLLRRPFRSILHEQALVHRDLSAAIEEIRDSQLRMENEMRSMVGDLGGRLIGELSDLQLAVHRLQSQTEKAERHVVGDVPSVVIQPDERTSPTTVPGRTDRPELIPEGAGVNLIGDLTATTGLAQAGRRLAVALRRRGVPMTVTCVRSGAPQFDVLYPAELRGLSGGTTFPVDLVTLNVNEVPAVASTDLGLANTGRLAVGAWAWEFEMLTPELVSQVDRVDEIWAMTTFVKRALGRYTSRPIHVVPTVVPVLEASAERRLLRQRWSIADDAVVFLFSFDFNSSVVRKNPLAVVEAYRRAFGPGASRTRLVMKAFNLANSAAFEADLRAAVQGVGGMLIDEHLPDQDVGDLFHAADVYVSLHRSEGFGLGMAEAMAVGKAVIGTAYSGNLDFMTSTNSCLVGYQPRAIIPDDHRYSEAVSAVYQPGFYCAEPDVDQAARWMAALAADSDLRQRIGRAAAATIASRFSEAAVVDKAVRRLEVLWQ